MSLNGNIWTRKTSNKTEKNNVDSFLKTEKAGR